MSREKKTDNAETEKNEGLFSDVVKKVISVGVGAAFMTEDVVKKYINDLPISKDMASGLLNSAKGAKEDFVRSIQEELKKQFSKVDPKNLVEEMLEKYDVEVSATFRFKKKKDDNSTSE